MYSALEFIIAALESLEMDEASKAASALNGEEVVDESA